MIAIAILAFVLVAALVARLIWIRPRGVCPECRLGTLRRAPLREQLRLPAVPNYRVRMLLRCGVCGATVVDGFYRVEPISPHKIVVLESLEDDDATD